MSMSQEKLYQILNYFFLTTGGGTAGVALNLQQANDWTTLVTKVISVLSFLCFLLINQDKISNGWRKFINRFKLKKNGNSHTNLKGINTLKN